MNPLPLADVTVLSLKRLMQFILVDCDVQAVGLGHQDPTSI